MKFEVNTNHLKRMLSSAYKAMDRNDSLPVRNFFLVYAKDKEIWIFASSQEISVSCRLETDLLEEESSFLLSPKVMKYLDKLQGDSIVKIEGNEKSVKVISDNGYVTYNTLPAEQYPLLKTDKILRSVSYPINVKCIEKVFDFVGSDVLRPAIESIHISVSGDSSEITATDGHTIARMKGFLEQELRSTEEMSILIPKRVAQFILEEKMSLNVLETENCIILENIEKTMMLSYTKINSNYPRIEIVLENNKPKFNAYVNTQSLKDSMSRILTLGEKRFYMIIRENDIVLKTQDSHDNTIIEIVNRDEEDERYGYVEDVEIILAATAFDKAVKKITEKKIEIQYTDSKSVVYIKGKVEKEPFYLTSPFLY